MDTSYPDRGVSVKPPCLEIPLEVTGDPDLSDGAILLFGEIFGLHCAYGNCNAGDEHFMTRRHKSRSAIQSQLKELRLRGHITIETNKHSDRKIFVAERYLNFPENEKDADTNFPEIWKDQPNFPENSTPTFRKTGNNTHKTESSESLSYNRNSTKEDKTPESSVSSFSESSVDLSRFSDTDQKWMKPFLESIHADLGYATAVAAARDDVVEMALLQSLKAKKDDKIKSSVLGIIRSVVAAHGDCTADYVAERVGKLRTALGGQKRARPKSHQPYRHSWSDGIDMAGEVEDPAQTYRSHHETGDANITTLAEAAMNYTPAKDLNRSDAAIALNKRGVEGFKAAIEVAKKKHEAAGAVGGC